MKRAPRGAGVDRAHRSPVVSYPRLAFSLFLFALGGWYAFSRQARFQIGGDDLSNRHPIPVDAQGLDAIVIGCVFIGVGLVNLAIGVRGRLRRSIFWAGAALLGLAVLYGVVNVVRAIVGLSG